MGFFEKIGLVERRDEIVESDIIYSETLSGVINPVLPVVKLEEVRVDTLISDIYSENELADTSKSIFKIQELSDTLPKEMTKDTKRLTVLGILKVSGLSVDEVVADGVERTDILNAVNTQIVTELDKKVADANTEIESLKAKIEELQKLSALAEAEKQQSTKQISDELNKVAELCKFISGGNQ